MLDFLAGLLGSVFGSELGFRSAGNREVKQLHRTGELPCLYRETPDAEWHPKTCRVRPDGLELTMYPFGASFVLRPTSVPEVAGSGPMTATGPTTLLRVACGKHVVQLAVPDSMLEWFMTRTCYRAP